MPNPQCARNRAPGVEKVHVNDLAVFKRDSGKSYRIRANTVFANHVHADEFRAIGVFETGQDGPLGKIKFRLPTSVRREPVLGGDTSRAARKRKYRGNR